MYTLYLLGSLANNPDALWLSYEWDESFENREWRPCVEHFLNEVCNLGYDVVPLASAAFTPGEDCIEITYLVGGTRTTFKSDLLLSLITIHQEDPSVLRGTWNAIGEKIGWER